MSPADPSSSLLVLAEGMVIDELAVERLRQQLRAAPDDVVAVAAMPGELPPGSSVHATTQRAALRPLDDLGVDADAARAIVVRPDVHCEEVGGSIRPGTGRVLLDPGAFVLDTSAPPGPLLTASSDARPVFPCRPVVLLLGCEPGADVGAWAGEMADALVPLEVDARVAVPAPAPRCSSSRPCRPDIDSVRTLDPDVVIALDQPALDALASWIPDHRRATTIIALDPDVRGEPILVSWRLGRARDRLRARIGTHTDPVALAALVARLASGPHPRPPALRVRSLPSESGAPHDDVPEGAIADDRGPRSLVVITGALDGADDRTAGLVESARSVGHDVEVVALTTHVPPAARHADLVILRSVPTCDTISQVIELRTQAGLPTVLDVGPGDIELDPDHRPPTLTERAEHLVRACRLATTPSSTVAEATRDLGAEALMLPSIPTTAVVERLDLAGVRDAESEVRLVGWRLDAPGTPGAEVVGGALRTLLDERPGLIVQILGDPAEIPEVLTVHARAAVTPGDDDPASLAAWSVQVWSPAPRTFELTGGFLPVIEAGAAGVPTVVGIGGLSGAGTHTRFAVSTVADPGDPGCWVAQIERLLDDGALRTDLVGRVRALTGTWTDRSRAVRQIADLLRWVDDHTEVAR
jgi:hypothetical protein